MPGRSVKRSSDRPSEKERESVEMTTASEMSGSARQRDGGWGKKRLVKTEFCVVHATTNRCPYPNCKFAHDMEELRPRNFLIRYKTQRCRTFHEGKNCRWGARCLFLHNEYRLSAGPNKQQWWIIDEEDGIARYEDLDAPRGKYITTMPIEKYIEMFGQNAILSVPPSVRRAVPDDYPIDTSPLPNRATRYRHHRHDDPPVGHSPSHSASFFQDGAEDKSADDKTDSTALDRDGDGSWEIPVADTAEDMFVPTVFYPPASQFQSPPHPHRQLAPHLQIPQIPLPPQESGGGGQSPMFVPADMQFASTPSSGPMFAPSVPVTPLPHTRELVFHPSASGTPLHHTRELVFHTTSAGPDVSIAVPMDAKATPQPGGQHVVFQSPADAHQLPPTEEYYQPRFVPAPMPWLPEMYYPHVLPPASVPMPPMPQMHHPVGTTVYQMEPQIATTLQTTHAGMSTMHVPNHPPSPTHFTHILCPAMHNSPNSR